MDHQKRISDELWNGDTYDERIPDSDAEDLITSRLYSRAKWGRCHPSLSTKMQSGVGISAVTPKESPIRDIPNENLRLTKVRG